MSFSLQQVNFGLFVSLLVWMEAATGVLLFFGLHTANWLGILTISQCLRAVAITNTKVTVPKKGLTSI